MNCKSILNTEVVRRLEHIVRIHFNEDTGTPYWLDIQKELGIDVVKSVRSPEDLSVLGPMDEEALTVRPIEDFIARLYLRQTDYILAETAGTLGRPKFAIHRKDEFRSAFITPFVKTAERTAFPSRCHWLFVGPTGPHVIGRAARCCARALNAGDVFTVDFDPRWAKKLSAGSFAAQRYLEHIEDQALRVLAVQNIGVLFSTPAVLGSLAEKTDEGKLVVHVSGYRAAEAAIQAGSDAIYLCGEGFVLHNGGFSLDWLRQFVGIATRKDVRVAVTMPHVCDVRDMMEWKHRITKLSSIANLGIGISNLGGVTLARVLPGDLCRSFFCCSGSEANEGAALLATLYTGRNEFLAFQNGLHGRTKLGMSLTGLSFWRTDPNPVGGTVHVPPPNCFRCVFGQEYGQCRFQCVDAVERAVLTATSGKPAAMFVEPVQGNGGIVVPPPDYFPKLRELLDKHKMLLIADEVQTGFGPTGKLFAMEHWNVTPDIVTGGKALGGGTPVGFFCTTDEIAASYTRPGASTFGGNPVTAQAGLKFLEILGRESLVKRSARVGAALKKRLKALIGINDIILDVRGAGLMVGAEIAEHDDVPAAERTDAILEQMKDAGYLIGKTGPGRNVLTFMPPLIIAEDDINRAVDALEKILQNT